MNKTGTVQNLLFFGLLLFYVIGFSQTTIEGKIIDEQNQALSGTTITVTKINERVVIAYAISTNEGTYSLGINSKLDSLQINVSHLGHAKLVKKTINKNQTIHFTLQESDEKLKEVFIKSVPITKKGDTINYTVSEFKEQKDRVIADVLKKMPGIEVLDNGTILYQGKPLVKYYIEGLDLLEGRYNLANNNLPADAVSKVQILENHQPIKILDSLVYSDKAALNIKLKKNSTLTGTAKLGIGNYPFLWDTNVTPMLFAKKQQMITSYQTNNTGNDLSNELKILTIEDLLDQAEGNHEKKDWVAIQQLSPPPFAAKRWLDNNVHMFTTNYLVRLKKEVDLKVNLSYINDFQKQNGITQTTFYIPNDTISIIENVKNKLFLNSLKNKFILTKNTSKNYFKNTFEVNKYWDSNSGIISSNDEEINQKVSNPFTSISNRIKWIQAFGKKLITINSVIIYTNTPQDLTITLGYYEDILNNENPYDKTHQKIRLSNFYTNNAVSYTQGYGKFTFTPKIGLKLQNQQLDSRITLFKNLSIDELTGNYKNNLSYNNTSFYTILNTQYNYKNWNFELETPFKFQGFDISDVDLNKAQKLNRLTFEPRVYIRNDINSFLKTTFTVSSKKDFGEINQLYYGYIVNNYRGLNRYDTPILESERKNISLSLNYRNPIKSVFANASYATSYALHNLMFGNLINSNGSASYSFIEKDNSSNTQNISLSASKYFSDLKTTLTLMTSTSLDKRQQLLNGIPTNSTSKNNQINGKINTEITAWMSLNYKSNYTVLNTLFNRQSIDRIVIQEHLWHFSFYPTSNQYIGFDTELYKNKGSGINQKNYFLNLNYRFTLKRSKIDLELNWNNILNKREFTTVYNNSFFHTQSTYMLRPSQLLASIKFNF